MAVTTPPVARKVPHLELVHGDLLEPRSVVEVVDVAAGGPVPLRAVVNLVGAYAGGLRVHESDPGEFERQLTDNLRPAYLVTRAVVPHLIEAGGLSCRGDVASVALQ